MSVEDTNTNAYPDAWEPDGPAGAQMGMGGGTSMSVDNSTSITIDAGAVMSEVHVAANADADRAGIIVREATTNALQQVIERLARQLGKRVRVRI